MSKRHTFEQFREKALKKPGVREEYEVLGPAFDMKRQMIAMRKAAGLTQEEMAEKLSTKKSNISRLESLNSDVSPRFSTVEEYARVLGYRVKVDFEPREGAAPPAGCRSAPSPFDYPVRRHRGKEQTR